MLGREREAAIAAGLPIPRDPLHITAAGGVGGSSFVKGRGHVTVPSALLADSHCCVWGAVGGGSPMSACQVRRLGDGGRWAVAAP